MAKELRAYASQNRTEGSIIGPVIMSVMGAAMSNRTFLRYKNASGEYSNVFASFFNFMFLPPGEICLVVVEFFFVHVLLGYCWIGGVGGRLVVLE